MVKSMNIIEIGIELTHFGIKISLVAQLAWIEPSLRFIWRLLYNLERLCEGSIFSKKSGSSLHYYFMIKIKWFFYGSVLIRLELIIEG